MVSDAELFRWSVPELQEWAQRLTDQGWAVTPIRAYRDAEGNIKKRPLLEGWLRKGLLTDADIDSFAERRPTHLALVLGSEHVGLDFENKNGANVRDTYTVLQAAYGSLPAWRVQRTLTGGFHGLLRIDRARVEKFSARALLPDGTETAVDVVREGYLCLVLYDPDFPGVGPGSDEIPWLPEPWYRAISPPKSRPSERTEGRSATQNPTATKQVRSLVQEVADAKVGKRNNTLSEAVRTIVRDGRWTDQIERDVISAALSAGQGGQDVRDTVASAVNYGLNTIWCGCLTWLASVKASGIREPSEAWDLACLLCARIVAANRSCDEPFAISDREFAEHLGIYSSAVRRRLQSLVDHGLLARHAPRSAFHLPTTYRLLAPVATGEYRTSHSEGKNARALERGEGMERYAAVVRALARVELGRHSAFQQIGEGPRLPRAGIRILDALSSSPEGLGSSSEIARVAGLNRGTVRSSVEELADAGLVMREGRRVRVTCLDVIAALDEWCDLYDVPDRIALRREWHEQERKVLDLYDRRKYRGRHRPPSVGGRVSLNPEDWDADRRTEGREDR